MKKPFKLTLGAAVAFGLGLSAAQMNGASIQCADGSSYSGEIVQIINGELELVDTTGTTHTVALDQISPASQGVVDSWKASNPQAVETYTKFDNPPSPKKTSNPRDYLASRHQQEKGTVSVDIVIDAEGEVVWAEVAKSDNGNLDEASVAAVSEWIFFPAKVGGKRVQCKIRLPLRF